MTFILIREHSMQTWNLETTNEKRANVKKKTHKNYFNLRKIDVLLGYKLLHENFYVQIQRS